MQHAPATNNEVLSNNTHRNKNHRCSSMVDLNIGTISDFVEVFPTSTSIIDSQQQPEVITAIISKVEPKCCSQLLKELAHLLPLDNAVNANEDNRNTGDFATNSQKWADLSHLRRVKRYKAWNTSHDDRHDDYESKNQDEQQHRKKQKKKKVDENIYELEVVLGEVSRVEALPSSELNCLVSKYNLVFEQRTLPGRIPVQSETKAAKQNPEEWPLIRQHRNNQITIAPLLEEEVKLMIFGMKESIRDAYVYKNQLHDNNVCDGINNNSQHNRSIKVSGAVVMCSKTKRIISCASEERTKQWQLLQNDYHLMLDNPLATPIILAIQGVSRIERQNACAAGCITGDTFRNGQYLCTGLTMFVTEEPSVYEAMALVHSRISRVIYGIPKKKDGGLGGDTINRNQIAVHNLPGTNHHYRVFCCTSKSELYGECTKLNLESGKSNLVRIKSSTTIYK